MPIHFDDQDVASQATGLSSALIVPCNMCPAATVAVRDGRPFMQLFRSLLKSPPFEEYISGLQSRLEERGVSTKVFKSSLYHQWFLCMWTARRRKKLERQLKGHEAVIVLGCESATETVRDVLDSSRVRVIEGMKVAGIMNAKLRYEWPDRLVFADCKVVPISQ